MGVTEEIRGIAARRPVKGPLCGGQREGLFRRREFQG
jgi:hypothetical protein